MAVSHDLVIRNGRIADGMGSPLFAGDIAIEAGKIAKIGQISGGGREEIDAKGLLVTPGFVDIHTHYDGQATWDERLAPSSWHGVTTVVMGNCGVGFAPVRAGERETLIELMEGVEDIPGTALHEGLTWDWESFGEYLDALGRRVFDIDVCAQLPHGPLRLYVMGKRALELEAATPEDIAKMRMLTAEAMRAGALGFSTSRSINHKSIKGDLTPSYRAREEELLGIALGMSDAGSGVFEWVSDFADAERDAEYAMIENIVRTSQRPFSISIGQTNERPDTWRLTLALIDRVAAQGFALRGQVAPRPVGAILGLTVSYNPFIACPSFAGIARQSLSEKVTALHDESLRARIIEEAQARPALFSAAHLFRLGEVPDYAQPASASIAQMAEREGRAPLDMIYDLLLEDDGKGLLLYTAMNYWNHNYDVLRTMITNPNTVIGLGDGGAHVGAISDASFATSLLTLWGRDNGSGAFDVSWLVKRQTSDTAKAVGLLDRGVIAPGMKADLNIIDFDRLGVGRPYLAYDLPAGGKRLLQRAQGYVTTVVSGVQTYCNGEAVGPLPGKLVRGPQARPK